MTTRLVLLVVAALLAWDLKRHYSEARVEELSWILTPTTQLTSAVTGVDFEWRAGEGYFSRDRLFLIEKSCAGVNFMIAAFAMLILALLHRAGDAGAALRILGISLGASYVAAVLVNSVRIVVALQLAAHPDWFPSLGPAAVHRIEGIAVYFGGLVLLHELVRHVDRRPTVTHAFRRMALPLLTYYAVTLGVPLANGAAQAGTAFITHAAVVLLAPPSAILVVCAGQLVSGHLISSLRTNRRTSIAMRRLRSRAPRHDLLA